MTSWFDNHSPRQILEVKTISTRYYMMPKSIDLEKEYIDWSVDDEEDLHVSNERTGKVKIVKCFIYNKDEREEGIIHTKGKQTTFDDKMSYLTLFDHIEESYEQEESDEEEESDEQEESDEEEESDEQEARDDQETIDEQEKRDEKKDIATST